MNQNHDYDKLKSKSLPNMAMDYHEDPFSMSVSELDVSFKIVSFNR